jgi:membrane protease YdiL (CAAX protease family)
MSEQPMLTESLGGPIAALPKAQPPVIGTSLPGAPVQAGVGSARPWGFWATLGFGAVTLLAWAFMQVFVVLVWVIASMVAHHGAIPRNLERNGLLLALAVCAAAPVMIGLSWLFARIRRGMQPADYLGCRAAKRSELVRWTIVLLVMILASDALTSWMGRSIVPEFMARVYQTAGFLPLFWVAIVIAAPFAEEVLFRGFLFEGMLHSRLGATGAILLTSLLWSLIHLQYDAYGIATIFVSGLLLGYVRLKTRSLYATIFLHCLMNAIATLEAAVMLKYFNPAAGALGVDWAKELL